MFWTRLAAWSALGLALLLGGGWWLNTRPDPGLTIADRQLRALARASEEIVVVANTVKGRPVVARLQGEEIEEFTETVRLENEPQPSLRRRGQYVLRFERDGRALGAVEVYLSRGWITLEPPRGNAEAESGLEAPFALPPQADERRPRPARVVRRRYAPRLRAFFERIAADAQARRAG